MKQFGGLSTNDDEDILNDENPNNQNLKIIAISALLWHFNNW